MVKANLIHLRLNKTDIDQKLVYDALKNRLDGFQKLRKVFAQFL